MTKKTNQAISAMLSAIQSLDKTAKEAATAALRKVRTHVVAVSKREAAAEAGVRQKDIAGRYESDPPGPNGLRVWVGTNPLPVTVLGEPRQTKSGVSVGRKKKFPGAFVATMKSGHRGVFIRRGSRHYDATLYRKTRRTPPKPYFSLPIAEARGVSIERAVENSFSGKERDFADFFRRAFYRELNYRKNIRKK